MKELAGKRDLFLNLSKGDEIRGSKMAEEFMAVADYASKLGQQDLDKAQLELASEYAGLFLGVWKKPAHPSESAYNNPEHLIMQKPRDDVMKIYRAMGLEKPRDFTEPEDHIAIELQFMAHVSGRTSQELKNNDLDEARKLLEVQSDFLNEHLGKWVPLLVEDMLKSARREFYKAIANITKGYVETDKETVAEMKDLLQP